MSNFSISPSINNAFLINLSKITGRLDPIYNLALRNSKLNYKHKTKSLDKIVHSFSGGTPDTSKAEYWNGNIPWVSPKDFKEFYIADAEDKITETAVRNSSTSIAPAYSVLIVFRSGVLIHSLPVAINNIPVAINQDLKALIPDETLIPEYLAIYFNVFATQLLPLIVKHSTTVQSINSEQFFKLKIPIPSMDIQENIIKIHKTAYEIKRSNDARAQQLLDSIDSYLLNELGITLPAPPTNSLKNRTFITTIKNISGNRFDPYYYSQYFDFLIDAIRECNHPVKKLKDVTTNIDTGRTPPRNEYLEEGKEGISIIKAGSYTDEYIDLEKCDIVGNDFKGNPANKGDIFILGAAHQAEYVGKKVYYLNKELKETVFFVGELVRVSANNNICNSLYLFSLLRSQLNALLLNREKRGQTSHLYPDDVKNINIPIPPLEKQKEIAEHINAIRQQAQDLKQQTQLALQKANEEIERILLRGN